MIETAERLARIETHISAIQSDQAESKSSQIELRAYLVRVIESQETRLRGVEIDQARVVPRLNTLGEEIGTLRKRAYTWDVLNTLGALVAGALGMRQG